MTKAKEELHCPPPKDYLDKKVPTRVDVFGSRLVSEVSYLRRTNPGNKKTEDDNMTKAKEDLTCPPMRGYLELCRFQSLCLAFKDSLSIPEKLFDPAHDLCYCESCYMQRGDLDYYSRGQPAKRYEIPVSWVRFGVRPEPRAAAMEVFDTWHRAYHGTHPPAVALIFKTGNLVPPGREVIEKEGAVKERPGHYDDEWKPEGFDTKQVFVSPSIVYAGNPIYARPTSFKDPASGKTYSAQTVLQVCIKPGSYTVGRHTTDAQDLDPLFSDSELEWSTKTFGAIIIYGLLIRLAEK